MVISRCISRLVWMGALVLFLGSMGPLAAEPITFTFEATGTGNLGGQGFTDVAFIITVTADTDQVRDIGGGVISVAADLATIDIAGFDTATFTTPKRVFDNHSNQVLGFSQGGDFGADLLDIRNPDFATYDLQSDFGPVFDPNPFAIEQFHDIPTDLGILTVTRARDVTFTAQLGK